MNLIDKKEDSLQQRLFYSNLTLYTQEKSPVRARNNDKLFLKKILIQHVGYFKCRRTNKRK